MIDRAASEQTPDTLRLFWTHSPEAVCSALHCGLDGLSSADSERRLARYGPNSDAEKKVNTLQRALLRRSLDPSR